MARESSNSWCGVHGQCLLRRGFDVGAENGGGRGEGGGGGEEEAYSCRKHCVKSSVRHIGHEHEANPILQPLGEVEEANSATQQHDDVCYAVCPPVKDGGGKRRN